MPVGKIKRFKRVTQGIERFARVPHEPESLVVPSDLLGVHVDVDDRGGIRDLAPVVRSVLVGARAHEKDKVCSLDKAPRMRAERARPSQGPKHTKRKRVKLVDRALAHVRRVDGQSSQVLKARQRIKSPCAVHAAARKHDRLLCLGEEVRRETDHLVVWTRTIQRIATEAGLPRRGRRPYAGTQKIGRQHKGCGSRAAGRSSRESGVHITLDLIFDLNAAYPFGAGLEQGQMIKLLKSVLVRLMALDLLDQGDKWNAGLERLGKRGHKKRGGRTVLGRHHPHPARQTGVSVGHHPTHVFLAIGDLTDSPFLGGKHNRGGKALGKKELDFVADERIRDALGYRLFKENCIHDRHSLWASV